jgi:hypothetical protein
VTQLGSRHEGSLNCVEDLDSSKSHGFLELLDFIVESNKLVITDSSVNRFHDTLRGLSVIENVEGRNDTLSNHSSTTTGFSHSSNELEVLNNVRLEFLSVVPESGVNDLTDKLNWRLSTVVILSRHVEVIDESNGLLLSLLWLVLVFGFLLVVRLNSLLEGGGTGSSREVDGESLNGLFLDVEERLNSLGLTDTGNTNEHDVLVDAEEMLDELRVTSGIYCWYVDVIESNSSLGLPVVLDEIVPRREVLFLGAHVVLVNGVSVRDHGLNISNENIKLSARLFLEGSSNRPDEGEHEDLLNVGDEVGSVSIRSLGGSSPDGIVKLAEVHNAGRFRGRN